MLAQLFDLRASPNRTLGALLLVVWIAYATTLFPVLDDYLLLSLFTLGVTTSGVIAGVVAFRNSRLALWIAGIAGFLLLARYVFYWWDIAGTIRDVNPGTSLLGVAAAVLDSGTTIIQDKLAHSRLTSAVMSGFNEFLMPTIQLLFLLCIAVVLTRRHPPNSPQSLTA